MNGNLPLINSTIERLLEENERLRLELSLSERLRIGPIYEPDELDVDSVDPPFETPAREITKTHHELRDKDEDDDDIYVSGNCQAIFSEIAQISDEFDRVMFEEFDIPLQKAVPNHVDILVAASSTMVDGNSITEQKDRNCLFSSPFDETVADQLDITWLGTEPKALIDSLSTIRDNSSNFITIDLDDADDRPKLNALRDKEKNMSYKYSALKLGFDAVPLSSIIWDPRDLISLLDINEETKSTGSSSTSDTTWKSWISSPFSSSKNAEQILPPSREECDQLYDMLKKEKGAVELVVPAGNSISVIFIVGKGNSISWRLRVQKHDLCFAVRVREQGESGAVEIDVHKDRTIQFHEAVSGRIKACDQTKQYVLIFNNSYSRFTEKVCCYTVLIEKDTFSELYESRLAANASTGLVSPNPLHSGFNSVGASVNQTPTPENRKKLKKLEVVSSSSSCDDFSGWEAINELVTSCEDKESELELDINGLHLVDIPAGEEIFLLSDEGEISQDTLVNNIKFKLESELPPLNTHQHMILNHVEYFERDFFYSIWMDLSDMLIARITLIVYQDIQEDMAGRFLRRHIENSGFKVIASGPTPSGYKIYSVAEGYMESLQPDYGLVLVVCKYRHSYRAIDGIEFDLLLKIKSSESNYMVPFLNALKMCN